MSDRLTEAAEFVILSIAVLGGLYSLSWLIAKAIDKLRGV